MMVTAYMPIDTWNLASVGDDLGADEAHVWRASLNQSANKIAKLSNLLSQDEYQKAVRYYRPVDRDRFIVGRGMMCGIPLPISTIHERCLAVAEVLLPIYKEMEKDAANAKILYGDDTWLRILELMKENETKGNGERVGIQATGIVAEREDGVKIALNLNGRRHTGENVGRLLEKREDDLGPVIRTGDAAAAN